MKQRIVSRVMPALIVGLVVLGVAGASSAARAQGESTKKPVTVGDPRSGDDEKDPKAADDPCIVIRSAIGVEFSVLESYIRRSITSSKTRHGLLIRRVDPGSCAAAAGLKKGDILLEWGGQKLKTPKQLRDWLEEAPKSATVELKISRKGRFFIGRSPWHDRELDLHLGKFQPKKPVKEKQL